MAVAERQLEADSFAHTEIAVEMDPRLQLLLAQRSRGVLIDATASSEVDEVPVIAKVTDTEKWEATSEVRASTIIGARDSEDGTSIVTGRIPAKRIEAVRSLEFVKSLKAAQPLRPTLAAGVEETNARPERLVPIIANGGKGVVIGVVDYGCDFAHRNFKTLAGRTRLLSIWHQGGHSPANNPRNYGKEYSVAEIDAALGQSDPYAALGYGPERDTPRSRGTHGTHVMDICAGNGAGSGVPGFAPDADIVFVDVSHADLPFDSPDVVGTSFGDSTRLLEALQYIFEKAGDRPCVINVSLGTNGGPHDGSTLVEQGIDRLLVAAPNRAVTIAASNSFDDGIHSRGQVPQDGVADISWRIPPGHLSSNEFELWYSGKDRISVEVINPAGQSLGTIAPGENGTIAGAEGVVEVFAANRVADPNNRDNQIGIFVGRRAMPGIWILRLRGDSIVDGGSFHAWIERDNVNQSSFVPPHDNTHTIGSISCGKLSIAVGSYDAHKPGRPLSWFSSAGPTRDGRQKPEISGPGHDVAAAHSRTGNGVISKSGTSMAAPAVAGVIALVLGEALARNLQLTADGIRDIVMSTARRAPPDGAGWDDRFGNGRIDAAAAVRAVIERPGGPPEAAVAVASSPSATPPRRRQARAARPRRGRNVA